jgi:hypothetical protein
MAILKRLGTVAAVAGLAAVGIAAAPHDAKAWWGVGVAVPPIVVGPPVYGPPVYGPPVYAPPAYYAPPPVAYVPPPAYYPAPRRVWVPPHWDGPYWVRGHWS